MPINRSALVCLFLIASLLSGGCQSQQTFNSPDEAVAALDVAVQNKDAKALRRLFGSHADVLKTGDPEQDKADLTIFARRLSETRKIQLDEPDHATLLIGKEEWPFAVPIVKEIVKEEATWRFDTDAGIEEVETRRIGRNERLTIAACRTVIDAQAEFFERDPDGTGVKHYAQKLKSAEGKRDGLYWPVTGNEDPSPIGPVLADSALRKDAAGKHIPYNGYNYKLLTKQGLSGPGGAMDYMVDGRLTHGWAAIAYPAEYDETGIMSFLFGSTGVIYEKDLGEDSAGAVAAITTFDPGDGWKPVGP